MEFSIFKYNKVFGIVHWVLVLLAVLLLILCECYSFSHPMEAEYSRTREIQDEKRQKADNEKTDVDIHYESFFRRKDSREKEDSPEKETTRGNICGKD